jgi:membrane-associated phospholipid phosphatase
MNRLVWSFAMDDIDQLRHIVGTTVAMDASIWITYRRETSMTTANQHTPFQQILIAHWRQLVTWFVAVLLPLCLFGLIAEDVAARERFFFDQPILEYVHRHASPSLDSLMLLMSHLGYVWGVVPVDIAILLWLIIRRKRRDAAFFGVVVIGAAILNVVAKAAFGRERPKLWPSLAPESTFSFPSGHAMGSMALVTALIVLCWPTRWRVPMLILGGVFTLLVGFSRIYLGVHYPSDVIAGWLASFAWALGASGVIYGRFGKPHPATAQAAESPTG